jgi:hypothetical protein
MRIPRFRSDLRQRGRPSRAASALFVLVLVAGNVLAAMGVCIAKTPPAPVAVVETSGEAPCPQHFAEAGTSSLSTDPAAPSHCPQDDPGAQVRVGDLPAADVAVALPFQRMASALVDDALCSPAAPDDFSYTPLYARLSRLLL